MFIRLKGRAVPLVLLVISSLWMAAVLLPFFYSLVFPNVDIRHIVWALEGRETLQGNLAHMVEQITSSGGHLKRGIQVAIYWGGSAEYKIGESHTTRTTDVAYLAWFEKRSKPTIFVIERTEIDGSRLIFRTYEGTFLGALRVYLLPASAMALSLYWLRRSRILQERMPEGTPPHN